MIIYFEMSEETESEKDGDFGSIDLAFVIPLGAHGLFVSLTEEPEIAGFKVLFIGFTIETDMLRFLSFKFNHYAIIEILGIFGRLIILLFQTDSLLIRIQSNIIF